MPSSSTPVQDDPEGAADDQDERHHAHRGAPFGAGGQPLERIVEEADITAAGEDRHAGAQRIAAVGGGDLEGAGRQHRAGLFHAAGIVGDAVRLELSRRHDPGGDPGGDDDEEQDDVGVGHRDRPRPRRRCGHALSLSIADTNADLPRAAGGGVCTRKR
jgi:hypothetical protein